MTTINFQLQTSNYITHVQDDTSSQEDLSLNERAVYILNHTHTSASFIKKPHKRISKVLHFSVSPLVRIISYLVSKIGLGRDQQVKVNFIKRNILTMMGGKEIKFGFNGSPIVEGMFFESLAHEQIPHSQKVILLCTGSHSSYENYAISMVKEFQSMGHHVLVFNYEGFGESEGQRSEEGVYRSTEAAYQYLKQVKGYQDNQIVAWGYSLGSGAVCDLTTKHPLDMVLDRGFSSMAQVASQVAPNGLKTFAKILFKIGAHFDNLNKLALTQSPHIFIVQGMYDRKLNPLLHGNLLYQALRNHPDTTYEMIPIGHIHTDSSVWFSHDIDKNKIENFFAK